MTLSPCCIPYKMWSHSLTHCDPTMWLHSKVQAISTQQTIPTLSCMGHSTWYSPIQKSESTGCSSTNRHCGLVVSAFAWDETGCEFDSWQCRIYIPCSLSLRLLGSLRGSLGTYGSTQKLCLKKKNVISGTTMESLTSYPGHNMAQY